MKRILCVVVAPGVLCLLIAVGLELYLRHRPDAAPAAAPASVLFERRDLEARLSKATPDEVRRLLGEPEEAPAPVVGDGHLIGSTERGVILWVYHNRTRNPETGKPDSDLAVLFRWNRVSQIICAPTKTSPNPPPDPPLDVRW